MLGQLWAVPWSIFQMDVDSSEWFFISGLVFFISFNDGVVLQMYPILLVGIGQLHTFTICRAIFGVCAVQVLSVIIYDFY